MNAHAHNRTNSLRGRSFRPIRAAGALLSACLLFASCTRPPDEIPSGDPSDGKTLVKLTVSLPQPAIPRTTTRLPVSDEAESRIAEVRILVFEQKEGNYLYRYMVEGERFETAGNATRFEARLTSTDHPVKLLLAGNYGDAFAGYAPEAGSDEDAVKRALGLSFVPMTENLPMYGQVVLPAGLQADRENDLSVTMLRAVARVDVEKDLTADSRPFRLGSVSLYRANDKIQLIPDRLAATDAPRVDAPSVFPTANRRTEPVVTAADGYDPASIAGIYVPEAEAETDPSARLSEATCIVVGGYYDQETQLSYYRIDFDPGIAGHPFGQILRNYKYVFRIKKVNGPGWSDPDTAATSKATSIVAQVEAWEDFTTEMYFEGENYLGVSARRITLGYSTGKTASMDVEASIPYTIQWLDSAGTPTGTAVSGIGATTGNANFSVTIGRNPGEEETISHLRFTALGNNLSDNDVSSVLRIAAGRWRFDVTVTQRNPAKRRNRIIRVLSVTEIGSLGSSTPASSNGLPLRRILDNANNFSPTGTVVIGGFSFTEISRAEIQATGTGSASDKEIFRSIQKTLNAQDVIYLTYNSPISNELGQSVLAWLRGNANRVLIVGCDTNTTNANLRQYLTADGTWKYYNLNNIGGAFKRAATNDANKRFFTSPFGAVAENAAITRVDDYAGYCSDYPSRVTPLVVSSAIGRDNILIVGVNVQDRIVYHGDANLNQTPCLSSQANTNGTVTSDFDRLTANLWAWIVDRVVPDE